MNRWIVLCLLWVLMLLQVVFLAAARPLGVVPQLLIIGLFFVAMYRSVRMAWAAAAWSALWLWVTSISTGWWVLMTPFLFVLLIMVLKRLGFNLEKTVVQASVLLVAVVLHNAIVAGSVSWQMRELLVSAELVRLMVLEGVFTLVFAWALRPLLQLTIRPL